MQDRRLVNHVSTLRMDYPGNSNTDNTTQMVFLPTYSELKDLISQCLKPYEASCLSLSTMGKDTLTGLNSNVKQTEVMK